MNKPDARIKIIGLISLITIVFTSIFLISKYYYLVIGANYARPNTSHQVPRAQNIRFHIVSTENMCQRDTLSHRLTSFFSENYQFNKSIYDSTSTYQYLHYNGTEYKKYVSFDSEPIEIYSTVFNFTFSSKIDKVLKYENNSFVEYEIENLSELEKERIKNRLKVEILDKINWSVDHISY